MTIQNKLYEGLAMARPVVSGESHAVRQAFDHGIHLFLCERANGSALASSIQTLKNDPKLCESLSINGYNRYREKFDLEHNGQRYRQHLLEIIDQLRKA
jgi:glycosyltransferase involved in cell wall biosynthesis